MKNLKLLIVLASAAAAFAVGLPANAGHDGVAQAQNTLSLPSF